MQRDPFPTLRPEFAGLQHGPQTSLWPEEPCGHAIFRPEQTELFGPEVVALDCDSIIRGFVCALLPPTNDPAELERREMAAANAVRAWWLLDHFTRLHQSRPALPEGKRRIMARVRQAAALQAHIDDGNDSPEARGALDDRLRAARATLVACYPGIELHGFVAFLDL
ncbi:hypothetical protein [Methyloversatilis sp.]|uniref:hypothetical protein n=1 Tax=Methyloversatilis sp. TaxID=2569862 RepID=UPI0035B43462